MSLKFIHRLFAVLILSASLQAQAVTLNELDSQEQNRINERAQSLQTQNEAKPDVRLKVSTGDEQGKYPENEQPCFKINEILLKDLSGNKPKDFNEEDFQWMLEAAGKLADGTLDVAIGRCLGSSGINLLVKRVQNSIVSKGFITTRVVVQPQNLTTGTLVLTLVPGRIRDIHFLDPENNRATSWNAIPASSGDLLNLRDIEQSLENFKRVPSAEADIKVQPSSGDKAQPGDSDLVVDWKQGNPLRINLSVDDSGSYATGKYQGSATLSYDNWWTLNDLFYISFNRDLGGGEDGNRGSQGHTIHYSVPFGYWSLAFTASENQYYQTVAGSFVDYVYSGDSSNRGIKLSRMVYRDASRKTSLSLNGWLRSSRNYIDDTEVVVQRRRMAGWELGLSHQEFIGNGALNADLTYRRGVNDFGSLPAPEEAFGEGTSQPELLTSQVQLSIPFQVGTQKFSYNGLLKGQLNYTPLISIDRFSIGSRYSVRGYDGERQLSSESGWLIRNELGMALKSSNVTLYLGLDYGDVSGPTSKKLVGTALSGGVIGVRGGYKSFNYDLFLGAPISKPKYFTTSESVAGFSVSASF